MGSKKEMKNGLKKKAISTLSVAGICTLIITCSYLIFRSQSRSGAASLSEESESLTSHTLRAAPDFELPDRSGTTHRLRDLKGAPIVLHFWASWCPPCLAEISKWVELASAYHDRPIQWVAISLDQNWADALKAWNPTHLAKLGAEPGAGIGKILSLLDTTGKISDQFGTYQFPETYLISSDLKIVTKWVGPQDWGGEGIRKLLDEWAQKSRPTTIPTSVPTAIPVDTP